MSVTSLTSSTDFEQPYEETACRPWPWWLALALFGAVTLVELPALIIGVPFWRQIANNVATWMVGMAMLVIVLRAVPWYPSRAEKHGWIAITASVLLLVVGDAIWVIGNLIDTHTAAFHLAANLCYLVSYVPLWIGLLMQPSQQTRDSFGRMTLMLEILIALLTLLTVLWYLSVGPALQQAGHLSALEKVLTIALPALDLATLVCALTILLRSHLAAYRLPRAALAMGVALMVIADSLYTYQSYQQTYASGNVIDSLWTYAYLCFALAALLQVRAYQHGSPQAKELILLPSRWRTLVTFLVGAVLCTLVVLTFINGTVNVQNGGLLAGTVIIFILVLLHQWVGFEENRRLYKELREAYRDMAELAHTDPMTGLPNYRTLLERLEEEVARADRYQTPLALIFADIDHFKRINDTYGHRVGDQVLQTLAGVMHDCVRTTDCLARYAGEEFIIVLPQSTLEQARSLAERLRRDVEMMALPMDNGDILQTTVSLGISAYPDPSTTLESLLTDADNAMLRVKREGRNGIAVAQSSHLTLPLLPL